MVCCIATCNAKDLGQGGGQGSPGSHGSHFTGTDYAPKIGNTLGKLVVAIFFFLIINHLISILRN